MGRLHRSGEGPFDGSSPRMVERIGWIISGFHTQIVPVLIQVSVCREEISPHMLYVLKN